MNAREVAMLLTGIAAIDDRVDPDMPRVAMWVEVLDDSMPFEFAKSQVVKHYGSQKSVVMPADLNMPWRLERQRQRQQDEMRRLESAEYVPAPADLLATLRALARQP